MERKTHRLTAKQVAGAKDGWHADGGNLFLRVADGGKRKHWVLRWTRDGKTTEMGLGGTDRVSLSLARQKRDQAMEQIESGLDPISERRKTKDAKASRKTFGEVAALVIAARQSGWRTSHEGRNASLADWTTSLTVGCAPIAKKYVDEVTVDDIKRIVQPYWDAGKHTTARRTLNRIELVIEYALAHGWRTADNPATWKRFQHLAPSVPNGGGKQHHPAVGWRDMPALMAKLRKVESTTALALEFLILTGTRSGETRGAKWSEIDWDAGVWTVPHERMKRATELAVPLSRQAMELLRQMQAVRPKANARKASGEFIFPGANPGRPLNNESMFYLTKRLTGGAATTHGFRSSFRDWCGDHGVERELAELALGHAFGSAVETAYARSSLIERRRPIMQAWADYLGGETATATVVQFKDKRR
jgi:integrase